MKKYMHPFKMKNPYETLLVYGCLLGLGAYGIYFILQVISILMNGS